jgi:hypothetical protein
MGGLRDLTVRMGHDSERAAIIHQHQVRRADPAIAGAIDAHIEAVRPSQTRLAGSPVEAAQWPASGPWRPGSHVQSRRPPQRGTLTWALVVERVTRIELALSAWE